ncbi:MAG: hypothetical protein KAJ39_10515 [Gammaproteobacteria bacterium]|nr:hypothetical protein [Gammaproteobacteria bacterium]
MFETGGVLSDEAILEALEKGYIVIDPFYPEMLTGTACDLRIASEFYRVAKFSPDTIVTPHDPSKIFKGPFTAKTVTEWKNEFKLKDLGEKETGRKGILLAPFERILGHTVEFIGSTVPWITSEVRARSTIVRWGISIALDAGLGNPGYYNSWTVEIINLNKKIWFFLPIEDEPLAQIFFKFVANPVSLKPTFYQDIDMNLKELKAKWQSKHMLPKSLI